MFRLPLFVASMLLMMAVGAAAQAPKAGPSEPAKPLLDNERIRVSEMRLRPGAKIGFPNRPDQFAYLLTDATLVFSTPGHTPYQLDLKAGEATLLPAQSTQAENDSDQEVRAVLVEIKQSAGSAKAGSIGRSKNKGKGSKQAANGSKTKGIGAAKSNSRRKGQS
jgi:hypothetical protein